MKASSELREQAQPAESLSGYRQPALDLQQPLQTGQPAGTDVRVVTRLLIPNAVAGLIIGQKGGNIQFVQSQTQTRIQLSHTTELFPGTTDRIILLSGTRHQVGQALEFLLSGVQKEGERGAPDSMTTSDGNTHLRVLVPAALCGAIIGKGGATIREYGEQSQANITVSAQDRQPPGVLDRIVRISGKYEPGGGTGVLKAVALITDNLLQNASYSRVNRTSVGYGRPSAYRAPPSGYAEYGDRPERADYAPAAYPGEDQVEVTVPVADSQIGAIIGKKGEVISQLKAVCDVSIRISKRQDFMPGTRNRKVTISGTTEAVGNTQALIRQKLRTAPQGNLRHDERPSIAHGL